MKYTKADLFASNAFPQRHIGPNEAEKSAMLKTVGCDSIETLLDKVIPENIRLRKPLDVQPGMGEAEFLAEFKVLASKNKISKSYIGLGYYDCIVPSVILRNVLENPGWYTAYTPYQAEISQGRLEALTNYQTMVMDLTGMEIANSSLLDEGTAAAEAMAMLHRVRPREKKKANANTFWVADNCFPQTIDILKTRAEHLGIKLIIASVADFQPSEEIYGILLQYPDVNGAVQDYTNLITTAKSTGITVAVAADLLSLTLLKSPGEMGADVVLGNTQRFGVPLGFGGPHAAYFATKEAHKRQIPGRVIGVSIDRNGNAGYRMALQTREQHIRREKATSNICTAQVLLANMAGMYAVFHGAKGLTTIAERIHVLADVLGQELAKIGCTQLNAQFFDTLSIELPAGASVADLQKNALANSINFYYTDDQKINISIDETTTVEDLEKVLSVFAQTLGKTAERISIENYDVPEYSADVKRTSAFLTHPIFQSHHTETQMMRYLKQLENKDLSLTKSMIALGSCTMKLNAATQMIPVSWAEFSSIHPYAPDDQTVGYRKMFTEFEAILCEVTGFAAVSLQPNSGAQGEYAGLLVIKAYHEDRGDHHRNITLIPASAHGTNPASAIMAGMKVVVVKCDDNGNIDVADLRAKSEQHAENLSAIMITYPSTHGVYEANIKEICDIVHEYGGQIYMDGANMNAQVGFTNPGVIGADVCHLNLHKTFSIPHGGGGPGMGPIGVGKHLAPYLPGHVIGKNHSEKAIKAVSAARWGSAGIIPISYAYVKLLGQEGLAESTEVAILNANYIKARLEKSYPVLYTGENGFNAHEIILDCRAFKNTADVSVEDIAKRLIDYGFHAPTVSFPVAGTLMIEPTESESKAELDRFCDAMLAIYGEIQLIASGEADRVDNVLKNAPHVAKEVLASEWNHPYSREKAVYPLPYVAADKFWPAVNRVDNAHGDRNLMCACPPMTAYESDQ